MANRTGVEGAGKVALEVGGGVLNTALGTTAITQFWNLLGWAAALLLAVEGAAVGIDAAIQAPKLAEEETGTTACHEPAANDNIDAKEREMTREDYMRKIGRGPAVKLPTATRLQPKAGLWLMCAR